MPNLSIPLIHNDDTRPINSVQPRHQSRALTCRFLLFIVFANAATLIFAVTITLWIINNPDIAADILPAELVPRAPQIASPAPRTLPSPEPLSVTSQLPPTATPTEVPTATPTDVPTATPTDVPTATPTDVPTATPTDVPTAIPTIVPRELDNYPEYVCGDWAVNLREGAGYTSFAIVGQIIPGTSYQVVGAAEGENVSGNTTWYRINHAGKTSYITAEYIRPCNAQAQARLRAQTAAQPSSEAAVVSRVVDGDTIDVLRNGQEFRVRYIGVDTPERGETCYAEATNYNRSLVLGKTVRMVKDISETDQYGRLLRYIWVDSTFVNLSLVQQGFAEAKYYPPDGKHYQEFLQAQRSAPNRGCVGVAAQPQAPAQPQPQAPAPPQPKQQTAFTCPAKPSCGNVASCEEAHFIWKQCGYSRADGDGDGVPCETVCPGG